MTSFAKTFALMFGFVGAIIQAIILHEDKEVVPVLCVMAVVFFTGGIICWPEKKDENQKNNDNDR